MFSFYSVILDLIKARTHKYVRRIPVGATKTGATKYRYFYHGQEGHGKGLAHESELVEGASFVFSSGENKYHAHITKVDGNMITVKHDDGAKKGTEHIYTKEAFQKLVHHEHREALAQAKQKASKQLADFQQMKERGAKVKQETLDKLQAQVDKLAFIDSNKPKQEEPKKEAPENQEKPKATISDDALKQQIDYLLQSEIGSLLYFRGFSSNVEQLGKLIDSHFGKQLNESLLKDSLIPVNVWKMASRSIDDRYREQYNEQKKNKDFAVQYSDFYRTLDHVVKRTMTKKFVNALLLDTLNQLNSGVPTQQIDEYLEKKTAAALYEMLKSLVKGTSEKPAQK